MTRPSAEQIIRQLGLEPLKGEGGRFRQTYRAGTVVPADSLPPNFTNNRPVSTAIYYFLDSDPDCFSAMHRLPSDELWHFYLGDPVKLVVLGPADGKEVVLGHNISAGEHVQFVVPAETWFGAYLLPKGEYALMGTTVAPGFDFADYEEGSRTELISRFPGFKREILRLTRSN